MTPATITVQGSHTAWFDAERATVHVSAAFDGPDREPVFTRATGAAASVTGLFSPLHDANAGPVTWWSSDRVQVWSDRPWNSDGKRLPLVFHASIGFQAKFSDFDALARQIDRLAVMDGVSIGGIQWGLTDERRLAVTDDVRRRAVADAMQKAATYAAAAGLGTPSVIAVADPGMLGDRPGGGGSAPLERMAFAQDATMGSLDLSPEQIEVSCSVDVRFAAAPG